MVFQSFNLFPHLTALGNVMLAQRKVLNRSKHEAERIAREQLDRVGLSDKPTRIPSSFPAVSSSVWRSRGRLRWIPT
jgi:polar amino acid transport system ATP-binding protein